MVMDELQDGLNSTISDISNAASSLIGGITTTEAVVGGTAVAGAGLLGAGIVAASSGNGKSKTRKKKTSKGRTRDRKYISKQKHEVRRKRKVAGRIYKRKGKYYSRKPLRKAGAKRSRKSSSRRGIHYTKKGQPYILLRSGKARFIKKRSKR